MTLLYIMSNFLKLEIDSRETKLSNLIKERDLGTYHIDIEYKQLDIGDIQISYNDNIWIFERKTVPDLLASIKDCRYKEQKCRLISCKSNNCHISYIIEGDDIISNSNQRNQDLLSSIYLYTLYRDDIHLIFTKSLQDTCSFILIFCTKLIDKPEKFTKSTNNDTDYISNIKIKKNANITPDICYLMQLSQIPTISHKIAKNIQEKFPNMKSLISTLENTQDKIKLLCEIDKIGKEKAQKIIDYLLL